MVGKKLGVRHVLEGSVRKGGSRLIITVQLIEVLTRNHLLADKFDGALEDVFELQDRITEGVVGAIEPFVVPAEIERAKRKRRENLDAYNLYLKALPLAWTRGPEEAKKGLELLEKAIELDPGFISAHGLAAWFNATIIIPIPDDLVCTRALYHAHAVLGPNTGDALALESAGFTLALIERNYNIVLNAINRALKITPHSPTVFGMCSVVNSFAGHFEAAIIQVENSLSLSPFDPMWFSGELAMAYSQYFLEHYDLTAEAAQRCVQINLRYLS